MSSLIRWAGPISILGGSLLAVEALLRAALGSGQRASFPYEVYDLPLWLIHNHLLTAALFCFSLALAGLDARLAGHSRGLAGAGAFLSRVAMWLTIAGTGILGATWILSRPLEIEVVFTLVLAVISLTVALLLLGIATARANVLPGWTSGLPLALGLAPVLFVVAEIFFIDVRFLPSSVPTAVLALFVAGWVSLGYVLWLHRPESPSRPAAERAAG